ncbi:MAG: hypothetical protein IJQ73_09390 [Kiritimatiellae bacterium]|nr:hypothetical protein [Kiritimatiellia bacterium]
MKKLITIAVLTSALCAALVGCKSIGVERHGQSLATYIDTNGVERVVLDEKGRPVLLDGGWEVSYFQHWMWTKLDMLNATAGTGVTLAINGYESGVDTNLVALVDVSLRGTAELAAKIGAAIATCGASSAAEGGAASIVALAKQAYNRFVSRGGNVSKAVVSSSADGTVTVTDGAIGVQCKDGSCSDCADGSCSPPSSACSGGACSPAP